MTREQRFKYSGLIFYVVVVLTILATDRGQTLIRTLVYSTGQGTEQLSNDAIEPFVALLSFGIAFFTAEPIGFLFSTIFVYFWNSIGSYRVLRSSGKHIDKGEKQEPLPVMIWRWLVRFVVGIAKRFSAFFRAHIIPKYSGYSGQVQLLTFKALEHIIEELNEPESQKAVTSPSQAEPSDNSDKLSDLLTKLSPDVFYTYFWLKASPPEFREWVERRQSAYLANGTLVVAILSGILVSALFIHASNSINLNVAVFGIWGIAIIFALLASYNAGSARNALLSLANLWWMRGDKNSEHLRPILNDLLDKLISDKPNEPDNQPLSE